MAYAGSSDESSSFSQSNETNGSSQEDAPSGVIKGDRSDCGRIKTERQRIKTKQFAYSEDEQASPERLCSGRTNKSVRDKTKINLKSVQKETVRQHDKNCEKVNRQNTKTSSQLTDECDYLDYQSDHNSTAGEPVPKYDSLPHVNESRSDKTKIKVSEKRQEKYHCGIDLENRQSISKTKSKDSENKLKYFDSKRDIKRENYSPRNHGMTDHLPKQQERTNKKGSTSNIPPESLECEASESDSDTADHDHKKGRNNHTMTGEGSVPSIKGLKYSSSNRYTHINNSKEGDENRSRDKDRSNNKKHDRTDVLRRSTCKNPDKSDGKIYEEGYGHDMHMGSINATQGELETNKKEHSKKSDRSKKHARSSSRSSSGGSSSSINHDKNTSRSFVAGGGVNNHDGSSSRSLRSGSLSSIDNSSENSSQHCASINQGRVRGIAKTTTDKRSKASKTSRREDSSERTSDRKAKKSPGKKETDTDRASKTSRREDSSERTSDRKAKKSPGKKDTDTDRAAKTSRREYSSERTSDRKAKKSPGKKETHTDRASKTSREESTERTSDRRKSKKSCDKNVTDTDCASKTSREESTERTSDRRKSKKSRDKKKTDSDRASNTSLREDSSERSSDRKTKKSHDSKEIDSKNKTKGDGSNWDRKIYENNARRRSDSRGSSRERRRSHSKEKSRDKDSRREKGMHGNKHKESDRYRSSNDYDREKNRDRKPADIDKKNSSRTYRDRRDSRHLSEERAWNNRRKSSASSIDSGEYSDKPKRKEVHHRKDYTEDSNDRESKYKQPNYKHEWQFENEHGNWITYGQSNSGRLLQGDGVVTSDDIEKFFSKHRGTKKTLIEANNNQYFLNLIEMSQTNVKTSVRRRIRRVRKSEKHNYQSQNYNDDYHYVNARDYDVASSNFDRSSGRRPDTKDNQPTRKNAASTKFEWQFENGTGNWITYGKTNSAKYLNTGSLTTSDDIEQFYARHPLKVSMQIISGREQYILNFKQMTEVNIETLGHRRVRRVPKSSGVLQSLAQWLGWSRAALSGSRDTDVERYEWQFQDERGVWITYGQASSNGITAFSTAASSDDIENYYSNSPDKVSIIISSRTHTYVLDFKNMVQINQETLVQRPIRRVKKTSKGSNANHLGGVGQSGVTAGNGTNVGVNNFHNHANFGYGDGNVSHSFTQGVPRVDVGAGQHLNSPSFPCSWQFQDENGSWITYGQPSSTNQTAGSTTTSDDIEQYFSTNAGRTSMIIQSPFNRYVLDTQSMMQINQKTLAQKPVRRVMKQKIQPPLNFQQGF